MTYNYNTDDYIILSSSCKITQGKNRTLICDYLRSELYFIPNDYNQLIQKINRNTIENSLKIIDSNSVDSFWKFLHFLSENEIVFITNKIERFPERSDNIETFEIIKDAILEIDIELFDEELFKKNITELDKLKCNDIQLRILSKIEYSQLKHILNIINATSINYTEIHLTHSNELTRKKIASLIEEFSILSHVFVYSSPENDIITLKIKKEKFYPLLLGNIYYITDSFDNGSCCGNISKSSLTFDDINTHTLLKNKNGCLYKKITIDRCGEIKNCPSINRSFGNSKNKNIIDIINSKEFKFLGEISKDQIDICKECEFRYNCTDCRAFVNNPYSKPFKCGYNIETFIWEDWSKNSLKDKGISYEEN